MARICAHDPTTERKTMSELYAYAPLDYDGVETVDPYPQQHVLFEKVWNASRKTIYLELKTTISGTAFNAEGKRVFITPVGVIQQVIY